MESLSIQELGQLIDQGKITTNQAREVLGLSEQDLRRRKIEKRIAVALLDFVEKVSSGKSLRNTGKNKTAYYPARDAEIAVLPEVTKVLLEISQRLPE